MMFKRWFGGPHDADTVRRVYEAIVAQARQPWFYAEIGVPDTVSGRFDMIVLHAVLVIERLNGSGEAGKIFSQTLFDETFRDMDRSLREMGVGDLSVGKRIRKMAEVFYGRADAYRAALRSGDATALSSAINRNIFAGQGRPGQAAALAGYTLKAWEGLSQTAPDRIMQADLGFPAAERVVTS